MKPILSIIVPTYNCEKYISECLESVFSQMTDDCEMIVVDDGSSDATPEVLKTICNSHGNVRLLMQEHKGVSGTRNDGLSAAEGEYVAFLDCDDCLAEHFLETALPMCGQKADLLLFGIERVFLDGRSEFWTLPDKIYPTVSDFADEYIRTRQMQIYSCCNKFYLRSLLKEAHLSFDRGIEFGEDRLFNYKYLSLLDGRNEEIAVITAEQIMQRYIQRSTTSLSTQSIPRYFDQVMKLHRAKTETFPALSRGTDEAERRAFCSLDLGNEIIQTVNRFTLYPPEETENLPAVNAMIYSRFPSLRKLLYECGAADPDHWYGSQTTRQLVIDCLRTFYEDHCV